MVDLVDFLTRIPRPEASLTRRVDPAPSRQHYTVISADDHYIEPPDLFEGRIARRFASSAPRVVEREGAHWWRFEDQQFPLLGADAIQTWEPGAGFSGPVRFEEIRTATWNAADRVRDQLV